MRPALTILVLFAVIAAVFFSCAKYKDPKGYTDPRLTNPYCNDPTAVNYNVGFPGKPDSTVCIYPSSEFTGTYVFHDSVFNDTLFLFMDSLVLRISAYNHNKILVKGLCSDTTCVDTFTANLLKVASVDTALLDTITLTVGQLLCPCILPLPPADTVSGTFTIDALDSTLLHINLVVISDSGSNTHAGSARKQ
jgi:hypothetical protein